MRSGSAGLTALLAFLFAVVAVAADDRPVRRVSGSIDNDTVWAGRVLVLQAVTVKAGARLTVMPGTEVLFARGAGLEVSGVLAAVGTPDNLIRFGSAEPVPSRAAWSGIVLAGTGENAVLRSVAVSDAGSIRVQGGSPEITGCRIERGTTGVAFDREAAGNLSGNTVDDMTENGFDCQAGSGPSITGNTIRRCGNAGIASQRNSVPVISGNTISGCSSGIQYGSPAPAPEGNRIDNNVVGMMLSNVGTGMAVLRNFFSGNGTGLWIESFSSPRIEGNTFDNNETGILCFKSSGPEIVRNRIAGGRQGISCSQMSAPGIVANDISGNRTGLILAFSSYPRVNGNNFDNNLVQVKLENMSYDWEVRTAAKPQRGSMARHISLVERGKAIAGRGIEGLDPGAAVGSGTVDATGNWWGEKDTAEMQAAGAGGNIGSLIDGHDVPMAAYEGYPGEYAQDRVDFSGWKPARIPDAGIAGGAR